jgi:hypothetical protein
MPKAAYKSKRIPLDTPCAERGLTTGQLISLFACLASVREDLRTGRKDAAASQRNLVEQLQTFIARYAVLPIYVERDPSNGNLFFRVCQGSRKRPLPSDPSSAEFDRAYHAALLDAGENNDLDDWSDLRAFHAAQREAKHRAHGGQR